MNGGRLAAVSSAQAKYLWALLVLGVFYYVAASPSGTSPAPVQVPFLGVPLSLTAISLSAPFVLFFLLLVILGSMRAYRTAEEGATSEEDLSEAMDSSPNPLDLAVYTTADSPDLLKRILALTYPLFLSVFAAEATWLLIGIFVRPDGPAIWVFRILGALTGIPALILLLLVWRRAIRGLRRQGAA
jgi:hypothetical protein